jgi:predicted enzyme related to lactoylglutathione lyase
MTITRTHIRQLWPLLMVQDIVRSVAFYRNQLGFDVAGRAELDGRLYWCRLERGGSSVMLQQEGSSAAPRGRGVELYFICDDAEAMYAELSERGLDLAPPTMADYGMKQLFVPEPDGYSVCFESPTEKWAG